MAELADALDSGSNGRKAVQVQVLLPAPYRVFITQVNTRFSFCQAMIHILFCYVTEQAFDLLFFVVSRILTE